MQRKSGQIAAILVLTGVLVLVLGYQMYSQNSLQTSVLPGNQVGYPSSGYPDSSTPDTTAPDTSTPDDTMPDTTQPGTTSVPEAPTKESDPDANPPVSQSVVGNNIKELRFFTGFGQFTRVDGLQVPEHVPTLTTDVRWVNDTRDSLNFQLDDETSARTHFIAPQNEGEIFLVLMINTARGLNPVARYVYEVVSPLAIEVDFNEDGLWNFDDLVVLLRDWETLQPRSTQLLSVLLSRYE